MLERRFSTYGAIFIHGARCGCTAYLPPPLRLALDGKTSKTCSRKEMEIYCKIKNYPYSCGHSCSYSHQSTKKCLRYPPQGQSDPA